MVAAARAEGHDVFWARVDAPGLPDPQHLAAAVQADRILISHDTDFGDLIHVHRQIAACGVVLLRFKDTTLREERAARLVEVLRTHGPELRNKLTVVTIRLLRITPLPGG